MTYRKTIFWLVSPLVLAFLCYWLTFSNDKVFWYFYSFTTLFLASIAFYKGDIQDELKTIPFMGYGLLFGTLSYLVVLIAYKLMEILPFVSTKGVSSFLEDFGPNTLWHFILLFILIVPGEELFWRGFLQSQLKKLVPPLYAIVISAVLYGAVFAFSEFSLGTIAFAVIGAAFGILYEWKKSMPLIIVAHITLLLLFFIIFPVA